MGQHTEPRSPSRFGGGEKTEKSGNWFGLCWYGKRVQTEPEKIEESENDVPCNIQLVEWFLSFLSVLKALCFLSVLKALCNPLSQVSLFLHPVALITWRNVFSTVLSRVCATPLPRHESVGGMAFLAFLIFLVPQVSLLFSQSHYSVSGMALRPCLSFLKGVGLLSVPGIGTNTRYWYQYLVLVPVLGTGTITWYWFAELFSSLSHFSQGSVQPPSAGRPPSTQSQ